jgi:hypothetical protein
MVDTVPTGNDSLHDPAEGMTFRSVECANRAGDLRHAAQPATTKVVGLHYSPLLSGAGRPESGQCEPVTLCLQSPPKVSSMVPGLMWDAQSVCPSSVTSRRVGVGRGCQVDLTGFQMTPRL